LHSSFQPALGASILQSFEFDGRGLAKDSQWNRVLGQMSKQSEAFARCATDETQCTSRGMRYWLQILASAADLGRKEQLQAVNRFFNRWPYRSDREVYRVGEYWATPSEFMARSGDCEDYAIAKYFALRELGFDKEELRVVILMDEIRGIGHAVLAIYVENDILNQMRREVLLAKERGEAGIRNAGRERTISPALGVVRPGSDVITV
jgi:predicted transglutaminase-like cysteine proteinase